MLRESKENSNTSKQLYIDMGLRLRQERMRMNYTQEQVAEILNMSTAYYGKIERGVRHTDAASGLPVHGLSLQKLLLINQKLNVDITYLITGQEKTDFPFEYYLNKCPKDKRYDLEQILRYALNLATNEK